MKKYAVWMALACLLAGAGISAVAVAQIISESRELTVRVLDVGQGDAIFIRTPYHQSILIDGGPDDRTQRQISRLLPLFDRTIDLMILTHPHADHVRGLVPILDRFDIRQVYISGRSNASGEYDAFESAVGARAIRQESIWKGKRIVFGADLSLDILAPLRDEREVTDDDLNNSSVVGMLTFGSHRILLMGDAGEPVERELMRRDLLRDVDVLKVGHHGSKYASMSEFLKRVSPEFAIISSGKGNDYGHPHHQVLDRLADAHARVLRTDINGTVTVRIRDSILDIQAKK